MGAIILTIGEPGLTKPDLGLRFYVSGVRVLSTEAALMLTELADGDYRLSGLPDHPGATDTDVYEVTWESPEGVGGMYVYPERVRPPKLVIPIRETGLTSADVDLALYADEEPVDASALTVNESAAGTGDYVLTGWPSTPGSWRLVWRYAGVSYAYAWEVRGTLTGTRIIEIQALQRPFPLTSLDDQDRHMFSANYFAMADYPVYHWVRCLIALLVAEGIATTTDTFWGIGHTLPIGDQPGPFTTIIDTGGTAPLETHDGRRIERLSAQVVVRAANQEAGQARALAIYDALHGVRDITVTPVSITP